MSYLTTVLKDNPSSLLILDESSGSTAVDKTGLLNIGTYSGGFTNNLLPIFYGASQSYKASSTRSVNVQVNNDYWGNDIGECFGSLQHSFKSFSLEIWFHPQITTNNKTTIFADATNNIGLFYDEGNIIFQCQTEEVVYAIENSYKAMHLVAVYDKNIIYLFINGKSVAQKNILNFSFNNSNISLSIGPTANSSDFFLANGAAVYRYALNSDQVLNHFISNIDTKPIQIAYEKSSELYNIFDDSISEEYTYSYPKNKSFENLTKDGIEYNAVNNILMITKSTGSVTTEIIDAFAIPSALTLNTSKVEWNASPGVSVQVSLDGTTYTACENGSVIPGFTYSSMTDQKTIYIKIIFSSSDTSRYIPYLKNLTFRFYSSLRKHSQNNSGLLSSTYSYATTNNYNITFGQQPYDILSRHKNNGVRCSLNSGFRINTSYLISTIEFFYTPESSGVEGAFLGFDESGSYPQTIFYWNSSGGLIKDNIAAIYVNGVDKTSATSISSILTINELHHIVIVLSSPISGNILFNYNFAENSGYKSLYQNIAFYSNSFNVQNAVDNFNIYIGKDTKEISDLATTSLTITESGAEYYNNDWVVVQNS